MKIQKATESDKDGVLKILDEFRDACMKIISPEKEFISTTAKNHGSKVFDNIIDSPYSAIFIAKEKNEYQGIITIHKVPRLRRGTYYAEIEEIFVKDEFQGTEIAQKLIEATEKWSKENNIEVIHLKSGIELKRAHSFYKKVGFRHYAEGYEKIL
ncbi:MAG: GNAT family N-acetyltransferase [Candidatus Kerfeldbacteria bacterium]|jgi:GNAT superfamily N-acetyltransferase